jgi:hypothetical protein
MKSIRMRWAGHVALTGEKRSKHLVRKPGRKRPLSRPSMRDNIKINLKEIGWKGMDWIHLAQDSDLLRPHVNTVMNLWTP